MIRLYIIHKFEHMCIHMYILNVCVYKYILIQAHAHK